MERSAQWTFVALTSLESAIGTFTNSFIIFAILFSYWRHQYISGCEKIIAALYISNLCYTCATCACILTFTIRPIFLSVSLIFTPIFVSTFFIIISSAWLTASLCFYYYIKINNFSSNLLSLLKLKINSFASWMIIASILLSLFCSLLNILHYIGQENPSISISEFSNTSWPSVSNGKFDTTLYISFVSTFIPFFISVATTASTAWSLHLHKLKMVKSQTSSTSSNVRKYEGAIQIMICLLTFYALIYVGTCLIYFNIFDHYSPFFWVYLVILCSYSPLHSILLSLSTTKLKRAWMRMFTCNAESSNDDENREE